MQVLPNSRVSGLLFGGRVVKASVEPPSTELSHQND